jgi:hypothetical protein
VPDAIFFTHIRKALRQIASKSIALIKSPQGQQASITGDLATRKIGSNGSVSVEGKGQLWYTTRCHFEVLRKRMLGSAKTQCSSIF